MGGCTSKEKAPPVAEPAPMKAPVPVQVDDLVGLKRFMSSVGTNRALESVEPGFGRRALVLECGTESGLPAASALVGLGYNSAVSVLLPPPSASARTEGASVRTSAGAGGPGSGAALVSDEGRMEEALTLALKAELVVVVAGAGMPRPGLTEFVCGLLLAAGRPGSARCVFMGPAAHDAVVRALLILLERVVRTTNESIFGRSRDLQQDGAEEASGPPAGESGHGGHLVRLASMSPLEQLTELAAAVGDLSVARDLARRCGQLSSVEHFVASAAGHHSRSVSAASPSSPRPREHGDEVQPRQQPQRNEPHPHHHRPSLSVDAGSADTGGSFLRAYLVPPDHRDGAVGVGAQTQALPGAASPDLLRGPVSAGAGAMMLRTDTRVSRDTVLFANWGLGLVHKAVTGPNLEYFSHSRKFGWLLDLPVSVGIVCGAALAQRSASGSLGRKDSAAVALSVGILCGTAGTASGGGSSPRSRSPRTGGGGGDGGTRRPSGVRASSSSTSVDNISIQIHSPSPDLPASGATGPPGPNWSNTTSDAAAQGGGANGHAPCSEWLAPVLALEYGRPGSGARSGVFSFEFAPLFPVAARSAGAAKDGAESLVQVLDVVTRATPTAPAQ